MNSKAQVTVFIILGLLIMIAFGVVIYSLSSVTPETPESMLSPLNSYVTSCFELGLKEGVVLLLSQGGRLNFSDGLTIGNLSVPFSVVPPKGHVAFYDSEPPIYPFEGFPYVNHKKIFTGWYGFNRLPGLYNDSNGSIQHDLQSFVESYVVDCVSNSDFSDSISYDTPSVSVFIPKTPEGIGNEQFLSALLDWNIVSDSKKSTQKKSFSIKIPVRLASLYFFCSNMIDKDVSNVLYEPADSGFFSIAKEKVGDDSLITVTDSLSVVDGTPLQIKIARKNRRPALWDLNLTQISLLTGASAFISDDQLIIEDPCDDERYVIPLRASDPDDDSVSFRLVIPDDFGEDPGDYLIKVFASDGSSHDYPDLWEDYHVIQARVSVCAT